MKKICLALLVLALSVPAIASVTITAAPGPEVNSVVISYTATEEVRAFALEVTCTDGALVPAKTQRQGLLRTTIPSVDDANYYVTPTNASFNTVNSATRVWTYGSPVVSADSNGCIIEMASLYASNDPCAAHHFAPPLAGTLVKLFVDQAKRGSDNAITVTVTTANAKRGKVVLKGSGTSIDPAGLPAAVTLTYDCFLVGESHGGWIVTQAMADNWVQIGKPPSWCHPGHYMGDANVDCVVSATDILGTPGFKAAFGKAWPDVNYKPSCDINNDKVISATDILGDAGLVGSGIKNGWGKVVPSCTPGVLP